MHIYYVYIIECNDGTLYVGVTNSVERRFLEHCEGLDPKSYAAKRRPLKLVHIETFQWILDAIAREKQLKGWSAPKKQALMLGQEETLRLLARCRNGSVHDRPDRDQTEEAR
jgi:putative endonuclease